MQVRLVQDMQRVTPRHLVHPHAPRTLSSSHEAACGSMRSFANSRAIANMVACSSDRPYALSVPSEIALLALTGAEGVVDTCARCCVV
jgi:hypothetical protein